MKKRKKQWNMMKKREKNQWQMMKKRGKNNEQWWNIEKQQ
jgi:hypothetical protein